MPRWGDAMRKSKEEKSWYREIEIAVFPSLTSMTKDLKDDTKKRVLKGGEKEETKNERITVPSRILLCGGVCLGILQVRFC